MNIRRAWLSAVVAASVGIITAGAAHAQGTYPDKLIKMIVPAPPGGQTDVLARLLAQKMQQGLGQNVIIDNRGGAGGALGARALAAADPDGYTLFFGNTSTLAVIPAVSKNPGYDPGKEFCAGRERFRKLHDPGGAPVVPGQDAGRNSSLTPRPIPASSTSATPAPATSRI